MNLDNFREVRSSLYNKKAKLQHEKQPLLRRIAEINYDMAPIEYLMKCHGDIHSAHDRIDRVVSQLMEEDK